MRYIGDGTWHGFGTGWGLRKEAWGDLGLGASYNILSEVEMGPGMVLEQDEFCEHGHGGDGAYIETKMALILGKVGKEDGLFGR